MTRAVRILSALLATLMLTAVAVPSTAGAAQVTVRPAFNDEGTEMVVPLASNSESVPEYRLRNGYWKMFNISEVICAEAERAFSTSKGIRVVKPSGQKANDPEVTGFASQLARFNEARRPLVPLMRRLGLGYPPSLEDFSEVSTFSVTLPRHFHAQQPYEGEGVTGFTECRFELTQ